MLNENSLHASWAADLVSLPHRSASIASTVALEPLVDRIDLLNRELKNELLRLNELRCDYSVHSIDERGTDTKGEGDDVTTEDIFFWRKLQQRTLVNFDGRSLTRGED